MNKECKTCGGTGFSEEYCDGYMYGKVIKCPDCSQNVQKLQEEKKK